MFPKLNLTNHLLGFFIIYWIGKRYNSLAHEYEKSPLAFANLGLGVYFVSQFFMGIVIGNTMPDLITKDAGSLFSSVNILGILTGVLEWWIVYKLTRRNWEKVCFEVSRNYRG